MGCIHFLELGLIEQTTAITIIKKIISNMILLLTTNIDIRKNAHKTYHSDYENQYNIRAAIFHFSLISPFRKTLNLDL